MLSDFITAQRQLRRTPVQTTIAIATLALGICLTVTLGSMLKALVIDPFNYPQSDRIVQVWNGFSSSDYEDLRAQSTSFEALGVYNQSSYNIGGAVPVFASGARCTSDVLRALGVQPQLGRFLLAEDEKTGAAAVAVISHGIWMRAFGGASDIIGKHVPINGRDTEIVGVMPEDFEFQVTGFNQSFDKCEVWSPLDIVELPWMRRRGETWLSVVGRLKGGVSLRAADAEVKTIALRLQQTYPETNKDRIFAIRSLQEVILYGGTGVVSWTLFVAGVLVLLVACTNVACMLIAQGSGRQREFAVRLALGASRWHVARLLLIESLLLTAAGALVGLLASYWAVDVLAHFAPVPAGRAAAIRVDGVMVLFATALVLLSTVAVGLPSAFAARDTSASDVLRGGRGQAGTKGRQRLLRILIIGQVAVTLLLANTAALFAGSYQKVLDANANIATAQVVAGMLTLRGERLATKEARARFVTQLLERVRGLPGVTSAAFTSSLPMMGLNRGGNRVGTPGQIRLIPTVGAVNVTPDYFSTAGIPLLKGRAFSPDDTSLTLRLVVVNRTMAEQAWPGEDPIGKLIYYTKEVTPEYAATVIGVVADVRQLGSETKVPPVIYSTYTIDAPDLGFLVVRSSQDAGPLGKLLQSEITALEPDLPLGFVMTFQDRLQVATQYRRFLTAVMSLFVVCTIGLTMVGIYGTLSYYVMERTREIGVRMALGAQRGSVIMMVLKRVGVWLVIGVVLGVGGIFGAAKVLRALLFEMQPVSPPVLIASALLVVLAGLTAGLVPALRATKIQPIEALRAE